MAYNLSTVQISCVGIICELYNQTKILWYDGSKFYGAISLEQEIMKQFTSKVQINQILAELIMVNTF